VEAGFLKWKKVKNKVKAKKGNWQVLYLPSHRKQLCYIFVTSSITTVIWLSFLMKALKPRFWSKQKVKRQRGFFLDVARTLARQDIDFRITEEQNGKFVQIVQLLAIYAAAVDAQYRTYKFTYLPTIF
jgi:predicted membrane chloride channel (bestrophin family)